MQQPPNNLRPHHPQTRIRIPTKAGCPIFATASSSLRWASIGTRPHLFAEAATTPEVHQEANPDDGLPDVIAAILPDLLLLPTPPQRPH